MIEEFEDVLDQSLDDAAAGVDTAQWLERYPEYAGDLSPLLELAAQIRALPVPTERPEAVADGRQRLRAAIRQSSLAAEAPGRQPAFAWLSGLASGARDALGRQRLALRFAVGACVALLVVGQLFLVASAGTLPGDALYPVKRSWEQVHLALTFQPAGRALLEQELNATRQQEVQQLLSQGREATTELQGVLTLENGTFVIGGQPISLEPGTRITGALDPGVVVRAQIRVHKDGEVSADEITVLAQSEGQAGGAGAPPAQPPATVPPAPTVAAPGAPAPAVEAPARRQAPAAGSETPTPAPTPTADLTPGGGESRHPAQVSGPATAGHGQPTSHPGNGPAADQKPSAKSTPPGQSGAHPAPPGQSQGQPPSQPGANATAAADHRAPPAQTRAADPTAKAKGH